MTYSWMTVPVFPFQTGRAPARPQTRARVGRMERIFSSSQLQLMLVYGLVVQQDLYCRRESVHKRGESWEKKNGREFYEREYIFASWVSCSCKVCTIEFCGPQ